MTDVSANPEPSGERREEEAASGAGPVLVMADMLFASRIRGACVAAGVAVQTVGSQERLLQAAAAQPPALVIVDLELSGGRAFPAIRALRADERTRAVNVVAFASHTNRAAIEEGRDAGADRVLARSAFVQSLPDLVRGPGR